jgi:hypothetical protein
MVRAKRNITHNGKDIGFMNPPAIGPTSLKKNIGLRRPLVWADVPVGMANAGQSAGWAGRGVRRSTFRYR